MKQQEEITAAVRIQAIRGRKDRRRFKENLRERENMSRDSIDEEDYSDENYSEDEFNMSAASMLASPARTMAEAEQVESEGYLDEEYAAELSASGTDPSLDDTIQQQHKAALSIQNRVRGYKAKQHVRKIRRNT